MKLSLEKLGEELLKVSPQIKWITLDSEGVKTWCGNSTPFYEVSKQKWNSTEEESYCGFIKASADDIDLNSFFTKKNPAKKYVRYSSCLCNLNKKEETKPKEKNESKRNHLAPVLAFFSDGSTILFDSKTEVKEFFNLRTVDDVTRYLETGSVLPDGSTTLDYPVDKKFLKSLFSDK